MIKFHEVGLMFVLCMVGLLGIYVIGQSSGYDVLDTRVDNNQIIKGKFESAIGGYECIVVTSDYNMYRVWKPTVGESEDLCHYIPLNQMVSLALTKLSGSEGRYGVTDFVIMNKPSP